MAEEYIDLFEFDRGGLRVQDVDVEVLEVRFGGWAYPNRQDLGEQLALIARLKVLGDEESEPEEQVWTCGNLADFEPSEDGKSIKSKGPAHIRDSTNFAAFILSLRNNGMDVGRIGRDITSLAGLQCHLVRQKVSRPGLDKEEGQVLVASKILRLPWEKPAGKGKAKSKSRSKAAVAAKEGAAAAPANSEVDLEAASEWIMSALSQGTPAKVPELVKRVFTIAVEEGRKSEFPPISKLIRDVAQLAPLVEELGFTLEGGQVS